MESYQSVSLITKPNATDAVAAVESLMPEEVVANTSGDPVAGELFPSGFVGLLEVFVHEARDIRNICIYHKQDVYAKLRLTNDPEVAVSTRIINGAGRNPVFNEGIRLDVRSVDSSSSLRCEIWMLSRIKNYLEDQLLGFALVPLSDVLVANGKLAQEFSLSSTDLLHSPVGFVKLSLSYFGTSPDVIAVSPPAANSTVAEVIAVADSEKEGCFPCMYEKIEFPDLKVDIENKLMVSEYFGIHCDTMDTQQSSESLTSSESGDCPPVEAVGVDIVECFSAAAGLCSVGAPTTSSVSTADSSGVLPTDLQSAFEPPSVANCSSSEEKHSEVPDGKADSKKAVSIPIININIEHEQSVIQQDIVDIYKKSMQQFVESLANMKLPMDMEGTVLSAENSDEGSEKNLAATPKGNGPRVFYGSGAFF